MIEGDCARLTSNLVVVIGCLMAAIGGRDLTPVHTRTELVSVTTVPARPPIAMALVQPVPETVMVAGTPATAAPINPLAPPITTPMSPVPAAAPVAEAAASPAVPVIKAPLAAFASADTAPAGQARAAAPPRRVTAAHRMAPPARVQRPVALATCDSACRAAARNPKKLPAGHPARAGDAYQAPLPAVFIPIRNFGYFLQARFVRPQPACIAGAAARKTQGRGKAADVCR